jgi:hypothetical protein
MSDKVPQNPQILTAQAATFRTNALDVSAIDRIGYAIRTGGAGTLVGTWTVQYSNDYVPNVDAQSSDAKWDTYTLTTSPPAASGAPQTFGIILDDYEYKYVRIKFTYTSGTGDVSVFTQMKGT